MESEVEVDDKIQSLINKQEAGEPVSYHTYGSHIFRKLNGTDSYNRVDKINLNNSKIVATEKLSKPFSYAQSLSEKKTRDTDNELMEEQVRQSCGIYMPRKGGTNTANN
jgi:hypothetical protein